MILKIKNPAFMRDFLFKMLKKQVKKPFFEYFSRKNIHTNKKL